MSSDAAWRWSGMWCMPVEGARDRDRSREPPHTARINVCTLPTGRLATRQRATSSKVTACHQRQHLPQSSGRPWWSLWLADSAEYAALNPALHDLWWPTDQGRNLNGDQATAEIRNWLMTHCPAGISMLGLRPHHCLGLWYHPAPPLFPQCHSEPTERPQLSY